MVTPPRVHRAEGLLHVHGWQDLHHRQRWAQGGFPHHHLPQGPGIASGWSPSSKKTNPAQQLQGLPDLDEVGVWVAGEPGFLGFQPFGPGGGVPGWWDAPVVIGDLVSYHQCHWSQQDLLCTCLLLPSHLCSRNSSPGLYCCGLWTWMWMENTTSPVLPAQPFLCTFILILSWTPAATQHSTTHGADHPSPAAAHCLLPHQWTAQICLLCLCDLY